MIKCDKCNDKGYIKVNLVQTEICSCIKKQNYIERVHESGLPKKTIGAKLSDWDPQQHTDGTDLSPSQKKSKAKALAIMSQLVKDTSFPFDYVRISGSHINSLIFCGPKKSGKSMAVSIMGKSAIKKGASVKYYDWFDLISSLDRFDNKQEADELMRDFSYIDLVIIDGLESTKINTPGKNQMSRLIKKRMNNGLWTIVTVTSCDESSIDLPVWKDFYDDSMVVNLL